ncbi:MAG TPA: sigma factor-like helix-turn-helix DNA-binding protein [Patescibacteria group bacterium]|nr:sigma factor-like helix-turn-helix DNA-binding protein [Patescibacteria group bacterium]
MESQAKDNILDKIIKSQDEQKKAELNPQELVDFLLKDLSPREKDVLQSRYGLAGGDKKTLEEIGQRLTITRERVRQIENNAVLKVKQTSGWKEKLASLSSLIIKHINKHGYISSEEMLVTEFLGEGAEQQIRNCLIFILERFLNEQVEAVEIVHTEKAWKIKDKELKHYEPVVEGIKNVLINKDEPLELVDIIKELEKEISEEQKMMIAELESWDTAVHSCLEVSKYFKKNLFDKWGLSHWRSVNPKRMRDKIYLVLLKSGEPLHYREITEKINEELFDKKVAHPATVHNELILDERFVLVGRGIYALAEWGYKPGVIAEVVVDILRTVGAPMSKQEIVTEVLKSRKVKEGSIGLTLSDKNLFERVAGNKYILRKQV